MIKKGDKGCDVIQLQQQLVTVGYPVAVDGGFGTETEQALLAFQRDHMITATGQAPRWQVSNWVISSRYMTWALAQSYWRYR